MMCIRYILIPVSLIIFFLRAEQLKVYELTLKGKTEYDTIRHVSKCNEHLTVQHENIRQRYFMLSLMKVCDKTLFTNLTGDSVRQLL